MEKEVFCTARRLPAAAPFHLPPPAQPVGAGVQLVLENAPAAPEVVLRDRRRGTTWRLRMEEESDQWRATIQVPHEPTMLDYYFEFAADRRFRECRQVERLSAPNTPIYGVYEERDFQIAVYNPAAMPPPWTWGMVIYQIFPDRFARGKSHSTAPAFDIYGQAPVLKDWQELPEHPPRGRDFFAGDLPGVTQHLDYLATLGVDCIYLCPIFDAFSNHRYDTNDYFQIHPTLGDHTDFATLVAAAQQHAIRLILDAVYNHCSCDSIYFDIPGRRAGAYQDRHSPYYRWFRFDQWPTDYQMWMDQRRYPEFVECPEVEEFFLGPHGVTAHWLDAGIAGWRADAAESNSDAFWRRFRAAVQAVRPDAYLVSEAWDDATAYLLGDTFSAAMNYRFLWALEGFFATDRLTASEFEDRLATLRRDTPAPALLAQMNIISSHDTRRALSACSEDHARYKQMVAYQLTYPGAPSVYYGDEAGLTGATGELGRKPFPWGTEDQEILQFYVRLLASRRALPELRYGTYELLTLDDARRVLAFARRLEDSAVVVVFNAGDAPVELTLPWPYNAQGPWTERLACGASGHVVDDLLQIRVAPRGCGLFARA